MIVVKETLFIGIFQTIIIFYFTCKSAHLELLETGHIWVAKGVAKQEIFQPASLKPQAAPLIQLQYKMTFL